jgi:EpsI family protein
VANVCSGLRTLISVMAFGTLYTYVCRLRGPWRVGLFLMSVPVALVSNAVRIAALIIVCHFWDAETATGWFHDWSGVLIFVLAFLAMFGIEKLVLWVREMVGRPAEVLPLFYGIERPKDQPQAWGKLIPALGTTAGWTAVVMIGLGATGAIVYSQAKPPTWSNSKAQASMTKVMEVDGLRWVGQFREIDREALVVLETDDYVDCLFEVEPSLTAKGPTPPWVDFCVIYSRDNRKGTHPPDVCLEGGGNEIVYTHDLVLQVGADAVPCRELMTRGPGGRANYYLYTYKCGGTFTASFWKQQWIILWNGLIDRNSSGALIRLSTPLRGESDAELVEARRRLEGFMVGGLPFLEAMDRD